VSRYKQVVDESARIDSVPHWFAGVRLNFAENVLYTPSSGSRSTRSTRHKEASKVAITEVREGASSIRTLTWGNLRARVARMALALRAHGVRKGDRVAVVASNSVDTLVVFLGCTALGGIFSSSSTDMGSVGVLERLVQIEPVWVFVDDWAVYNGRKVDLRGKMAEIMAGMKGVKGFKGLVSQPRFEKQADVSTVGGVTTLSDFLGVVDEKSVGKDGERLQFERVDFRDPFLIVYSSGTTGQPKCIVHSTGGVVLSATKEGRLHRETGPESVCLQYTTTGWIMYLASVQALLFGARVVMYDGSPFVPDLLTFIRLVGEQRYVEY